MSQKWRRNQRWDAEHLTGWATPLRLVLTAFSSIPMAVTLLSLVALYAVVASVPVGLIVLGLTYVVYGLTIAAAAALVATPAILVVRRATRGRPAARFVLTFAAVVALGALAVALWVRFAWPALRYDPSSGSGLRLFASFVEANKSITLRRLPGFEMSEAEFYAWWPLRLVLALFITNLVTATVRRIEFVLPNLGVLTVHTGIVTIALGSMYYTQMKQEGDVLLLSGEPGPDGRPTPGPPRGHFYDNMLTALWVSDGGGWEQRPLTGVPRYNAYGMDAAIGGRETVMRVIGRNRGGDDDGRSISLPVPQPPEPRGEGPVTFRVVGYAPYATETPANDWAKADPPATGPTNPVRFAEFQVTEPPVKTGAGEPGTAPKPVAHLFLLPGRPADRVSENQAFGMEWTLGMAESRWRGLTSELPPGTPHALVIDVPASADRPAFRGVYPAEAGAMIEVGGTGYRVGVKAIHPRPPFPIITEGYRGATSSMAILRVEPPAGDPYDRWVYHRFPEIDQDLLSEANDRGMPTRRAPDPAIRISYLDASRIQIYIDERADGSLRAAVRQPGGGLRVMDGLAIGSRLEEIARRSDPASEPKIDIAILPGWPNAEPVERPVPVPEARREAAAIGTHERAFLGVEILHPSGWTRVVWLPFQRYLPADLGGEGGRLVMLPDGRPLKLVFGRRLHELPGFMVQLLDFEMIAYDHRGAPRDYQSLVRVVPTDAAFERYEHVTKLNAPLQAPFMWSEGRPWLANTVGSLTSRLNPAQFKFSQAGWDSEGWSRSQQAADRGEISRPFASFTILGVGNNPGIHIIAAGGVMMSVGIPWAFYIKPLIMRRRKRRIQQELAEGTYRAPAPRGEPMPSLT